MAKYQADVQTLLRAIGGRENIQAVSHCMTRMRFVLADPAKADTAAIEAIPAVKGTFTQAGQFQVIIGNDVAIFYNEFTACAGIEGVSKDAVKAAAQTNQSLLQRIMGTLGEIFAPIIPALICGGLILGFRNIIGEINFLGGGTQSLADVSQFWAGMYSFLWLIGEAVFHMLPVGIVWSITKKMGTTQILGIILGLTLVSPQLLNGFSVAATAVEDIPVWDFGFVQIQMIGYQGQVIAAMLAGFVLVYLEKFFKKICPEVVSMIVVPFCSLVPAVLVAHTIVGPIGWQIGDAIASVVYAGLTSNVRWLFAALFGLLYAPIVMTGLHHMTNAIDSQLVNLYGGTNLWPMIALSNIAQGSAVLAMSVLQKKNERAQQVNIPACISCYLGVTEPALFGVNLKYGFPLVCGMIGSACGAVISIGTGVEAYSIGVGGLPGILSIKPQFWLNFLIAMLVCIFVVRYVRRWNFLMLIIMIGAAGLLALPLAIGTEQNGATNWINLGGTSVQPSELVKLALLLILSWYMSRRRFWPWFAFAVFSLLVLMLQQDLGTALIYYATTLFLFYASTGNLPLTGLGLVGAGGAAVAGYIMFAHVKKRVAIWRNPWIYYETSGYQIVQMLMAIASGGLFGVGLGLGAPRVIPVYFTDCIFAVICEQFGVIFGALVLAMYVILILRGVSIASAARSSFHALLAMGATVMLGLQTFIIIGGVLKLIPLTGVTMPFVSYGGTSLVSCMGLIGLIQGVASVNQDDLSYDYEISHTLREEAMMPMTRRLGTPPTGVPVPPTEAPTPLATTMARMSGCPGRALMLFPSATAMDVKRMATGMFGMMAERRPAAMPNRTISLVGL